MLIVKASDPIHDGYDVQITKSLEANGDVTTVIGTITNLLWLHMEGQRIEETGCDCALIFSNSRWVLWRKKQPGETFVYNDRKSE